MTMGKGLGLSLGGDGRDRTDECQRQRLVP